MLDYIIMASEWNEYRTHLSLAEYTECKTANYKLKDEMYACIYTT